jgi:hypothetical protein
LRVLEEGRGELLGWLDPDDARRWMAEKKSILSMHTGGKKIYRLLNKLSTRDGAFICIPTGFIVHRVVIVSNSFNTSFPNELREELCKLAFLLPKFSASESHAASTGLRRDST